MIPEKPNWLRLLPRRCNRVPSRSRRTAGQWARRVSVTPACIGPGINAMTPLKKVAAVWMLIAAWSSTSPALDVCGPISDGEVWTIEDSPVHVSCDLDITGLTIEPGVEVEVAGEYELVVSARIQALGTQASPVVFKPTDENVAGWDGFFFEDAIDGSEFRWAEIEGSTSSGVHLVRSYPSFDHVTFRGNSAAHGGAIRAELLDSDLQVSNSLFVGNFAEAAGGAIYAVGPSDTGGAALEVTESIFLENHAGTTGTRHNTFGGAIYIGGSSRILRSTFAENEVRAYTIFAAGGRYTRGGAIYAAEGQGEIRSTTFLGNACRMGAHIWTPDASREYGGAVYLASGELLLGNSLLAENTLFNARNGDYRGSGLYVAGGQATLVNSTLASHDREALYQDGGQVEVLNSILFFNNAGGAQIAGSVLPTVTYSDIQNGFPGEGNISLNPIFDGQFGIVPPSPAIDAGNPSPEYNDLLPPGQGGPRSDMGYTGGPGGVFFTGTTCGAPEGPYDLTLMDNTVIDTRSYHVCGTLVVGPNYLVSGPSGNLTLRAGNAVVLRSGFGVGVDGSLTVRVD